MNVRENTEGGGAGGTGGRDRAAKARIIAKALRDLGYVPGAKGLCSVCGVTAELHPDCFVCGAQVCWDNSCIEAHMVACLVAAFKKSYDVDLPTVCQNCGRVAPFEHISAASLQAIRLIEGVPDGAILVGQLCAMFCPAPACLTASREWRQRVAAGFTGPRGDA